MGERKRRRIKFFAEHPKCCFCGGVRDAVEIDHQPPKIFFIGKSSPESLRFPSCSPCNRNSRLSDQIFAFYTRIDVSGKFTAEWSEMDKLINALHNNAPAMKPYFVDNREKRRTLRALGMKGAQGVPLKDIPIIGFNPRISQILDVCFAKLAVALFYKYFNSVAPVGSEVAVMAENNIALRGSKILEAYNLRMSDFLKIKNPKNIAEDQLAINISFNAEQGLFATNLRFNLSHIVSVIICAPEKTYEGFQPNLTITKEGFPWGIDLDGLIRARPDDTYYS